MENMLIKTKGLGRKITRQELKSIIGGMNPVDGDFGSYGGCKADCGVSEPGCAMVIYACQGDCVAYADGNVFCTSSGLHGVKVCNQ
ncbi:MAG: hypothetical protein ACP5N7_04805 [Candidatus Pacearchaeota archaeon]